MGKTVSLLQSCSPLSQLTWGSQAPVRVEETPGSSAEQTRRDEAGQHLLTALAVLFPTRVSLLFFFPSARTLCLTPLAESAVLSFSALMRICFDEDRERQGNLAASEPDAHAELLSQPGHKAKAQAPSPSSDFLFPFRSTVLDFEGCI